MISPNICTIHAVLHGWLLIIILRPISRVSLQGTDWDLKIFDRDNQIGTDDGICCTYTKQSSWNKIQITLLLSSFTICEIEIYFTQVIQAHFIRIKLPTDYTDLRNGNPFSKVNMLKGLNIAKVKIVIYVIYGPIWRENSEHTLANICLRNFYPSG